MTGVQTCALPICNISHGWAGKSKYSRGRYCSRKRNTRDEFWKSGASQKPRTEKAVAKFIGSSRSKSSNRSSPHPGSSPGQALFPPPARGCVATHRKRVSSRTNVRDLRFLPAGRNDRKANATMFSILRHSLRRGGGLRRGNNLNVLNPIHRKHTPRAYTQRGFSAG